MFATFALVAMLAAATPVASQPFAPVTYDDFQQNSVDIRLRLFNAISAENRAAFGADEQARGPSANALRR
jgi:hypothetical protein